MNKTVITEVLNRYHIIMYDGVCGFCDVTVQFILDHKPSKQIRFVAFQTETGNAIRNILNIDANFNTILFIENRHVYKKSTAVFHILKYLKSRWRFLYYFKYIPVCIRDFVYDNVSKYRYSFLGKVNQCRIPTPEERSFFITNFIEYLKL